MEYVLYRHGWMKWRQWGQLQPKLCVCKEHTPATARSKVYVCVSNHIGRQFFSQDILHLCLYMRISYFRSICVCMFIITGASGRAFSSTRTRPHSRAHGSIETNDDSRGRGRPPFPPSHAYMLTYKPFLCACVCASKYHFIGEYHFIGVQQQHPYCVSHMRKYPLYHIHVRIIPL